MPRYTLAQLSRAKCSERRKAGTTGLGREDPALDHPRSNGPFATADWAKSFGVCHDNQHPTGREHFILCAYGHSSLIVPVFQLLYCLMFDVQMFRDDVQDTCHYRDNTRYIVW